MIYPLRLVVFVTTQVLLAIVCPAVEASEFRWADQGQAIADGIFGGDQSGMFLWPQTMQFCAPLKDAVENSSGNDTTLLFSNSKQTKFHATSCSGVCSLPEENAALDDCQQALNGEVCLLYGAVRNGVAYDLTVSADGKKLSQVCNLQ